MIWENGIETCILSCKKQIASLCSIQDTGCLWLVHRDDPERWYEVGGGRGVQDWELMYTHGWFMSMYGNVWQKKVKIKIKKKTNKIKIECIHMKKKLTILENTSVFSVYLMQETLSCVSPSIIWAAELFKTQGRSLLRKHTQRFSIFKLPYW